MGTKKSISLVSLLLALGSGCKRAPEMTPHPISQAQLPCRELQVPPIPVDLDPFWNRMQAYERLHPNLAVRPIISFPTGLERAGGER